MAPEPKGLQVMIRIWPTDTKDDKRNTRANRLRFFVHGEARNLVTGEKKMFNEPGALLTKLGEWNADQARRMRSTTRKPRPRRPI